MGTLFTNADGESWAVAESHNWGNAVSVRLAAACAEPEKSVAAPQVFIKHREVYPREITSTFIVCGDCSGDEVLPRKTLLTKDGRCDNCGGASYVLASSFAIRLLAALTTEDLISVR